MSCTITRHSTTVSAQIDREKEEVVGYNVGQTVYYTIP